MGRTLILSSPCEEIHTFHYKSVFCVSSRHESKKKLESKHRYYLVLYVYLFIEVEKTFGTVDVMEGGERLDGTINGHGVKPHGSPRGDQHPVRRRSADEHLRQ